MNYCSQCGSQDLIKQSNFTLCQNCRTEYYQNPTPTAGALLVHNDKILLAKRNINPGKGLWAVVGGFVEKAEKLEQAIVRELNEELNLSIEIKDLNHYLGSYNHIYPYQNITYNTLFMVFVLNLDDKQVQNISINKENTEYKFFSFPEIEQLQKQELLYLDIFDIIQDFRLKQKVLK
jgi:NAD+ diphosphatase